MKAKELIDILQKVKPEAEVVFKQDTDRFVDDGCDVSEILHSLNNSGDVYIVLDT